MTHLIIDRHTLNPDGGDTVEEEGPAAMAEVDASPAMETATGTISDEEGMAAMEEEAPDGSAAWDRGRRGGGSSNRMICTSHR